MTTCTMHDRKPSTDAGQTAEHGGHGAAAPLEVRHRHPGHASGDGSASSRLRLSMAATWHCLSGCAIGEFVGLAIGVVLGLPPFVTMALATALGFASGYTLGLWPLVKRGMRWRDAFRQLWLGETISIATMELAMNATDYHVGGMQASSLLDARFWLAYGLALPAGFIVALPVNWWMLGRGLRQACH